MTDTILIETILPQLAAGFMIGFKPDFDKVMIIVQKEKKRVSVSMTKTACTPLLISNVIYDAVFELNRKQ